MTMNLFSLMFQQRNSLRQVSKSKQVLSPEFLLAIYDVISTLPQLRDFYSGGIR